MSTATIRQSVSVEDYLAAEEKATRKHEYIDGEVRVMVGTRNTHNRIATSILTNLDSQLLSGPCEVFNSDAKTRIQTPLRSRFYYADVLVTCQSNPGEDSFQDRPVVIVEVISKSTRRTDEGEKKEAYLSIPSLKVYLLVEQDSPVVVAHRRTESGFAREVYSGLEAIVPLSEVACSLPLAAVYRRVVFPTNAGRP